MVKSYDLRYPQRCILSMVAIKTLPQRTKLIIRVVTLVAIIKECRKQQKTRRNGTYN